MKLNCGETYDEKWERLGNWHRWFAWHPVRIGVRDCRWLEYIERCVTIRHFSYDDEVTREYRAIK